MTRDGQRCGAADGDETKRASFWTPASDSAMVVAGIPEVVRRCVRRVGTADIEFSVHPHVMTVGDVVQILGVAPESIVKSLVVETDSGELALASVAGGDRLDLVKCGRALGAHVRIARPVRLREVSKVPVGAISPLTWEEGVSLLDSRLAAAGLLHVGSGANTASLRVAASVLRLLPRVRWDHIREGEP